MKAMRVRASRKFRRRLNLRWRARWRAVGPFVVLFIAGLVHLLGQEGRPEADVSKSR